MNLKKITNPQGVAQGDGYRKNWSMHYTNSTNFNTNLNTKYKVVTETKVVTKVNVKVNIFVMVELFSRFERLRDG